MVNNLAEWKQGTKIGITYSSWRDITFGVPQGLILKTLLFNLYLYENILI